MKKHNRFLAALLAVIMVFSLAACGGNGAPANTPANNNEASTSGEAKKFVIAHTGSPDTSFGVITDIMVETMEGSGLFKVEVYPSSSLYNDAESIQGIQAGSLDCTITTCGSLAPYASAFYAFDKYFAYSDPKVGREIASDESILTLLNSKIVTSNMYVPAMGDLGFRKMSANVAINSLDDLKGLKIRCMENPIYVAAWNAMNISPTPTQFTEIYPSLQQGVIDAQENPIELFYTFKGYEVQKYIIDTNHLFHLLPIVIDLSYYNELTDEEKAVLDEACTKAARACQLSTDEKSEEFYKIFETAGCQHITIPDELREELKTKMTQSWAEIESRADPEMWALYNETVERIEASK